MLGKTCMQIEFVFERRVDLQAEFIAITLDFIAQQRARAGRPCAAIGLADVAVDEVQRRGLRIGPLPTVTRLDRSGISRKSP